MVYGRVGKNPHQPGEDQRTAEAEQTDADFMPFAFGETDQRHAPDAQAEFDEHQPDEQMHQGVAKTFQPLGIQRMALVSTLWLERMAPHQAVDHHAQHDQHGADQRLAQGGAGIAGGKERCEQRDRHEDQRGDEPEAAENIDGIAQGATGQAPGQRLVADQVGDGPAEAQDEQP